MGRPPLIISRDLADAALAFLLGIVSGVVIGTFI